VKFDYKPKMPQRESLLAKRGFRVSLGLLLLSALFISFLFKKPEPKVEAISPLPTLAAIDPAQTIQTKILESHQPVPMEAPWQTIKVRSGDTLSKIFNRLGIPTADVHKILTANTHTRRLASLQPGQTLKFKTTPDQKIEALTLTLSPGNDLFIQRTADGFQVEHKVIPIENQLAFSKGEIHNSLFSAGTRAGLDRRVMNQLVDIFSRNIDFALDLKPYDTFRVLYEARYLEGERIGSGHILAAEIVNRGQKYTAVRYTDKAGRTGYFSPDGYGMHHAFLRTPVNFARISSQFGSRNHPILHSMKQHKGVDYSAPHGTPVQATGDGKVIYAGSRGGYGKVIELQHGSRYSTLYAHLSKFQKDLKVGKEVRQGQIIGYVGRTGLATGDHLHYEFRIDGIHRDPLTVSLPRRNPIPEGNRRHFMAHAKEMIRLLDMHEHKINMAQSDETAPLSPQ
jgi:murein DD-endopeptidase MepM/ murein hydrolase activator NlpD